GRLATSEPWGTWARGAPPTRCTATRRPWGDSATAAYSRSPWGARGKSALSPAASRRVNRPPSVTTVRGRPSAANPAAYSDSDSPGPERCSNLPPAASQTYAGSEGYDAAATALPSGAKARRPTADAGPGKWWLTTSFRVATSHSRSSPGATAATVLPSVAKRASRTTPRGRSCANSLPVSAAPRWITLPDSTSHHASVRPSGDSARQAASSTLR